jgi:hypothetical protein
MWEHKANGCSRHDERHSTGQKYLPAGRTPYPAICSVAIV